jgi:hypothetical protein
LVAGILAWGTLIFWILDNEYIVMGYPIIAQNQEQMKHGETLLE